MKEKKKTLKVEKAIKARKKRKKRRIKRIGFLVFELLLFVFLVGAAFVVTKYGKFQKIAIDEEDIGINDGIEDVEGYTTVVLFGGDSREGQLGAGTHADTMIVVSIDNQTRELRMASIYRDTLLQQKDMQYHKANHAYFHGGPEEALLLLNKNLDLNLTDYVTVDFKVLVDVVDLLGGIDLDVSQAEVDNINDYLEETADVAGTKTEFLKEPGMQHLDGAQTVTYARIRSTGGGDYERTERQREVVETLLKKVLKTDVKTINKIIDKVFGQVSTSFSLKEIISLASGVSKIKIGETTGFPFEVDDSQSYGNAGSVVIPIGLDKNVEHLHQFLYPKEKKEGVSDTVQEISDEISYITGVVRPAEMDEEKAKDKENQDYEEIVVN